MVSRWNPGLLYVLNSNFRGARIPKRKSQGYPCHFKNPRILGWKTSANSYGFKVQSRDFNFLDSHFRGGKDPRTEITRVPLSFQKSQDFGVGNVSVQLWFQGEIPDFHFSEFQFSGGQGPPEAKSQGYPCHFKDTRILRWETPAYGYGFKAKLRNLYFLNSHFRGGGGGHGPPNGNRKGAPVISRIPRL